MAPPGRHIGRHRAPLRLWPALLGSGAALAVLLGGVLTVRAPADPAAAGGFTSPGGVVAPANVTEPGDTGLGTGPPGPASTSATPAPATTGTTAPAAGPSRPAATRTAAGTAATTPAATRPAATSPAGAPATRAPRTTAPAPPSPEGDRLAVLEDQVTSLINRERERAGCSRVHTDERMRTAARRHSTDMAVHDYFSHTGRNGSSFVDRLADAGYPRRHAAGENIAYGYPSAQSVVEAWMGSTGHRNNILNCDARATGVGLAYRGRTAYWTQEFGRD